MNVLSRTLRDVAFVCALVLPCLAPRANAGYWEIGYEYGGEVVTDGNHVQWKDVPQQDPAEVLFRYITPEGGAHSGSTIGWVGVVCTWHPEVVGDDPPPSLAVVVTAEAVAGYGGGGGSAHASNGCGDPEVGNGPCAVRSAGNRLFVKKILPNQYVWRSDKFSLSAWSNKDDQDPSKGIGGHVRVKAALVPVELRAASTRETYDPMKPEFLSGTNCALEAFVNVYPAKLRWCTLSLFGESIAGVSAPDIESGALIHASWDSTWVGDGEQLVADLILIDEYGKEHRVQVTGTVYNRALVARSSNRRREKMGHGPIRKSLAAMSHSALDYSGGYLSEPLLLSGIVDHSVFYSYTHGEPGAFMANALTQKVTAAEVTQAMLGKVGGSPVHYVKPPYNLVFIDACETTGIAGGPLDSTLAEAFGIPNGTVDAAYLGFHMLTANWLKNRDWSVVFFRELALGFTVKDAIANADDDQNSKPVGADHEETTMLRSDPTIIGDESTKLFGLYGSKELDQRYFLDYVNSW